MRDPAEKEKNEPRTQGQSSEFAIKEPLITKVLIKKAGVVSSILVVIILSSLVIAAIYSKRNGAGPTPPPKPPKEEQEQSAEKPVPILAYIKDNNSVWTVNINGKQKTRALELVDGTQVFTTLKWKEENKLGYAKCPTKNKSQKDTQCKIESFNLGTKEITPEISSTNSSFIRKFAWSHNLDYLAYIGTNDNRTYLYLKSGSINSPLNSFNTAKDKSNTQTRLLFTPDNQYVIYATLKKDVITDPKNKKAVKETTYPIIYIYRVNGAKVDEIKNASDPFLINESMLGYKKEEDLFYRNIGVPEETKITSFVASFNPVISPDNKQIAYWKNEGGFNDVVLGVFDTELNIHRNILRGIVLPTWLTNNKVIGIKADGCIGQDCLLYQFQIAALSLVDMNKGNVTIIDQGKSIKEITFNYAN